MSTAIIDPAFQIPVGTLLPVITDIITRYREETGQPGARINIEMPSYQYRDPHVKDKTVLQPSYL